MTIRAQLPDSLPPPESEPATLGMDADPAAGAAETPNPDAVRLLDHRTRARGVLESDAPPGRYLAAEGHGETVLIPLDRPITRIGRGLIADVRFEDLRVSRRHAIVAQRPALNGARVLDDRSANGTYVNGRRITIADLHEGDVLRLGPIVVRYVEIPPPFSALSRQEGRVFSRTGGSGLKPLAA
jgi:glutathione S-transferase